MQLITKPDMTSFLFFLQSRREVNSVIDKKKKLEGEVERLKHHLMTVEETYTHEVSSKTTNSRGVVPIIHKLLR